MRGKYEASRPKRRYGLLLIPILIVGAFTIIYVGWGAKRQSKEEILKVLPEASYEVVMDGKSYTGPDFFRVRIRKCRP